MQPSQIAVSAARSALPCESKGDTFESRRVRQKSMTYLIASYVSESKTHHNGSGPGADRLGSWQFSCWPLADSSWSCDPEACRESAHFPLRSFRPKRSLGFSDHRVARPRSLPSAKRADRGWQVAFWTALNAPRSLPPAPARCEGIDIAFLRS